MGSLMHTRSQSSPQTPRETVQISLSSVNSLLSLLGLLVTIGAWDTFLRPYLVIIPLVAATGWGLVGWLSLAEDFSYIASLSMATGVAVDILLSICLVASGWWHPVAAVSVLLAIDMLSNMALTLRSLRSLRRVRSKKETAS